MDGILGTHKHAFFSDRRGNAPGTASTVTRRGQGIAPKEQAFR
jgi:hypothetical protein